MKLKVCGMKNPANILEVATLQPDYLGFIFYPNSPRNFRGKIPHLPEPIIKTGVFVDAPLDFMLEMVKEHGFKAVQLHGSESPATCEALGNHGLEVIKVFSVGDAFSFSELNRYEGKADYFLFDTRGRAKGGNGVVFNWEILKDYPSQTPFFLSGGIGPEEAGPIKQLLKWLKEENKEQLLYGLDVNSRFEMAPGVKKAGEIKEFKKELEI